MGFGAGHGQAAEEVGGGCPVGKKPAVGYDFVFICLYLFLLGSS